MLFGFHPDAEALAQAAESRGDVIRVEIDLD
jgi:hypothetical protein